MISRVKGALVARGPTGVEIETAGGIVYEIDVPLSVLQRLPSPPREGVELRTLQIVREDSLTLYGFLEPGERELFKRLMSVTGVGARLALAMLSTYSAPRLARALVEKDVNALKQVSGVGKKTAERIALELADKVTDLAISGSEGRGAGEGTSGPAQEAVAALVALGYTFGEADDVVRRIVEKHDVESSQELIRLALQNRGSK